MGRLEARLRARRRAIHSFSSLEEFLLLVVLLLVLALVCITWHGIALHIY